MWIERRVLKSDRTLAGSTISSLMLRGDIIGFKVYAFTQQASEDILGDAVVPYHCKGTLE